MKLQMKVSLLVGAIALSLSSTALAIGKPEGVPPTDKAAQGASHGNGPNYTPADPTPGPKAGLPAKAKAYGRYCKGESKEHVKGEKGTAFSRCVTNLAQAASQDSMAPGQVCKGESRKHVKGEKGTAFSRCVKAVAKLRHDQEVASS